MKGVRAFILDRGRFALVAVLLALSLRLAMPGGVMPTFDDGGIRFAVCHGTGAEPSSQPGGEHAAHDTPCAFSGLAFAALSGGEPAIVPPPYGFAEPADPRSPTALHLLPPTKLRPPAQGPPRIRSV